MWFQTSTYLEFNVLDYSPFIFLIRPCSGHHQWVADQQCVFLPNVEINEFTDPFGNLCQRLVAPIGIFSVSTTSTIETTDASDICPSASFTQIQNLPVQTLPFLHASRYCESDRFTELANTITAGLNPGYDQCIAVINYIQATVKYSPGTGQQFVSACETHVLGHGVCRDLAHLGIALCRALSMPARMVVGYLEALNPMELHAWLEVYVGDRWYTFDPTQKDLQSGRVAIAYGRDAADVAIYTQFGQPVELLNMVVSINRSSPPELN
jgi:transglutaminase-like putative cysteine protease